MHLSRRSRCPRARGTYLLTTDENTFGERRHCRPFQRHSLDDKHRMHRETTVHLTYLRFRCAEDGETALTCFLQGRSFLRDLRTRRSRLFRWTRSGGLTLSRIHILRQKTRMNRWNNTTLRNDTTRHELNGSSCTQFDDQRSRLPCSALRHCQRQAEHGVV